MLYTKDDTNYNSPDRLDCCCDDDSNLEFDCWEPMDDEDEDCQVICQVCGECHIMNIHEAINLGIASDDELDDGSFI